VATTAPPRPFSTGPVIRILVIGLEGQLARSLAVAAPDRADVEIVCAGRPQVDFLQSETIARALNAIAPDVVINPAAYTAVDQAEEDQAAALQVNATAPGALAEACTTSGVPLIHLSTDYVFDGSKGAPYREDDPVAPLGVYGRTKLEGERRVIAASDRHLVVRTAWVHSPYGRNFVRTMLRLGKEREQLRVVADQRGAPTYAPHLASALLEMVRTVLAGARTSQCVHATNTGETTWFGLAELVFREAARFGYRPPALEPIASADYPMPAMRPMDSRLDLSRLRQEFGVTLPPWEEGVCGGVAAILEGT
jgi:dTDP-4-dehydrorhamnose reductase